MIKVLKIPLQGYRGSMWGHRGGSTSLRTSSLYSSYAVHRGFSAPNSLVIRFYSNKTSQANSVRCIKD